MLPFIFFFVPETAFRRENADVRGEESAQHSSPPNIKPVYEARSNENGQSLDSSIPTSLEKDHFSISEHRSTSQVPPKVSFARSLLPFNGRKTDESFFLIVLRPFPLFFHPAILWACLIQGTLIGWTVMIGVVLAVSLPFELHAS